MQTIHTTRIKMNLRNTDNQILEKSLHPHERDIIFRLLGI